MKFSHISKMRHGLVALGLVAAGFVAAVRPAMAEVSQEEFNKLLKAALASSEGQNLVGQATEEYLKNKQIEARKEQARQAQADMEKQFDNPAQIPIGNSPVIGPADAKITVIEFSDFECPYCSRGKQTMDELMKAYPKDVKLVFKALPLEFHQNAKPAAKAAFAAGKQGKFWEMYNALFDNQRSLGDELYTSTATKLGLNLEQFKKDMESADVEKQIDEDVKLARQNDISGTPGFFVNGVAVKGAYPLEHFKELVDRWLAKLKK